MLGYLDHRLCQIFRSQDVSFGGKSIIVFGDLKQLSPVGDRWIFAEKTSNPYNILAGASLWNNFKFFELTEIMRERDDHAFALALNNMSEAIMTDADIELFRTRVLPLIDVPDDAIHLFCSSADVNHYNTLKLAQIRTEEFVSTAVDTVKSANMSERSRESTLRHAQYMKTSETQGLPYILHLKTAAKYMVTVNIDTNDGLVNGATGQLMRIDNCVINGSILVTGLWIKFTNATVGTIARSKVRGNDHPDWTPI